MLHHWNIFQLVGYYTHWDNKLPSSSIIPIITSLWFGIEVIGRWKISLYVQSCTVCFKLKTRDGPYCLESTIDCIKYLVIEMEADQPIAGRTISTDRLNTSIESTNWFLDRGIATARTLQKRRTEYHLKFLTPKTERLLVQIVILKRRRKTFAWHFTPSKYSQKEKICCCVIDLRTIAWQNNW